MKSRVVTANGKSMLHIDGSPVAAMAYTTYFEERSRYLDFVKAGYKIFFVNVSFTALPINPKTGFTPFVAGIFEDRDHPDYSEFEDAVRKILRACPDAVIFPRIYVSMPSWWSKEHPSEVIMTEVGDERELLYSDAFRRDGEAMLREVVRHITSSDYAGRVGGWQICGGRTQEWFNLDYDTILSEKSLPYYRRYLLESYGVTDAEIPSVSAYKYDGGESLNRDENARHFALFANDEVARSVELFASAIKEETNHEQVVGTFYGYTYEGGGSCLFGSHGLRLLLDSPSIDFFSSPNAYTASREFGIDWGDMIPVDSLTLNGKLCFMECDIRTYLTTGIQEARPGRYPDSIYKTGAKSVWSGPPTPELSREALRKCFAHQITKGSAIWWFDMWGGWYDDPILMSELSRFLEIYKNDLFSDSANAPCAEVAVFADERAWANYTENSPAMLSLPGTRIALGGTGVPFDNYLVEDAGRVICKYKAAVFPFPIPSEAGNDAIRLCKSFDIPYITAKDRASGLSSEELRDFFDKNSIRAAAPRGEVVYLGHGFAALHSATGGKKSIKLPFACRAVAVVGADFCEQTGEDITFELMENGTAVFKLWKV